MSATTTRLHASVCIELGHEVAVWQRDDAAPGLYSGRCVRCGERVQATGERSYGVESVAMMIEDEVI